MTRRNSLVAVAATAERLSFGAARSSVTRLVPATPFTPGESVAVVVGDEPVATFTVGSDSAGPPPAAPRGTLAFFGDAGAPAAVAVPGRHSSRRPSLSSPAPPAGAPAPSSAPGSGVHKLGPAGASFTVLDELDIK